MICIIDSKDKDARLNEELSDLTNLQNDTIRRTTDKNDFTDARVIFAHSSYVKGKAESYIKEYCKKENINLILYSGGCDENRVESEHVIIMKFADAFNNNFKLLIDEYLQTSLININILMYGEGWRKHLHHECLELIMNVQYNQDNGDVIDEEINRLDSILTFKPFLSSINSKLEKIKSKFGNQKNIETSELEGVIIDLQSEIRTM